MARLVYSLHAFDPSTSKRVRGGVLCLLGALGAFGSLSMGCMNRATFEADMQSAPLATNPFAAGAELAQAPPTANTRQGDAFRITLADSKEVCVSGQTTDEAMRVKDATFVLESFASDAQHRLASVKSKFVKIIQDTERSTNRGTVEPVAVFEACFDNEKVFTAETAFLTMKREQQHVANPLFIAWHFTKDPVPASAQRSGGRDARHAMDSKGNTFGSPRDMEPEKPWQLKAFDQPRDPRFKN